MLDDIATWAFWIGILLWQVAAIVSLWLWGGVKRSALGHLAAGILALVSGTLFIHAPSSMYLRAWITPTSATASSAATSFSLA